VEAFEKALDELRAQFLRGSGERLARMRDRLAVLERAAADREALAELRRDFHGFAGVGTTYGFPAVTALGLEGEAGCDGLLRSGEPPGHSELAGWRSLLDRIRESLGAGSRTAGEPEAPAPTARRPSVLLVEDDQEVRSLLVRFGEREGYAMRTVGTCAEALAEMTGALPDAALIDLRLPDGTGYELIERLRALPSGESVPAIIVSGAAGFLDRVEAIHCGADGFFEKPVDWESLARRLNQLLERARGESPRVLSVEDEPDQAAFLTRVLESAGYEVRVVSDPKEFESALIAFRPELVLMDVLLPGVSGYDLARYLRQDVRYATLPILFLTTERQIANRIEAVRAGGDEHLTKPVSPGLLLSSVAARIERARFLRDLVDHDGLTRLLTHTAFLERVKIALARARRREAANYALALLDLDHFKSVNDRHGHPAGDLVLSALASLLRRRLRQSDTIGRLGGEEFAVLLEDLTRDDAGRLLRRLLSEFGAIGHRGENASEFHVTFSAGVAMLDTGTTDLPGWVARADAALYRAKAEGRNRVVLAD
jgi:diguanylate cyclase (GGDEF)-like protein